MNSATLTSDPRCASPMADCCACVWFNGGQVGRDKTPSIRDCGVVCLTHRA